MKKIPEVVTGEIAVRDTWRRICHGLDTKTLGNLGAGHPVWHVVITIPAGALYLSE